MCLCLCMGVCTCMQVSPEVEARGIESLWSCSCGCLQTILTWVLGTKQPLVFWSSRRAVHATEPYLVIINSVLCCVHVCMFHLHKLQDASPDEHDFHFHFYYIEIWKHLNLFLIISRTLLVLNLPVNYLGFLSVWSSLVVFLTLITCPIILWESKKQCCFWWQCSWGYFRNCWLGKLTWTSSFKILTRIDEAKDAVYK